MNKEVDEKNAEGLPGSMVGTWKLGKVEVFAQFI